MNDKYADVVRYQNYMFLLKSLQCRSISSTIATKGLKACEERKTSAENRYLDWMLGYEFPKQSDLAGRMSGLVRRVGREELGLYILRQDVASVCKLLEARHLEPAVLSLRKRLDKHLGGPQSADTQELRLIESTWHSLKDRVVGMVAMLQDTARSVYQIPGGMDIGELGACFDRNA